MGQRVPRAEVGIQVMCMGCFMPQRLAYSTETRTGTIVLQNLHLRASSVVFRCRLRTCEYIQYIHVDSASLVTSHSALSPWLSSRVLSRWIGLSRRPNSFSMLVVSIYGFSGSKMGIARMNIPSSNPTAFQGSFYQTRPWCEGELT